MQGNAGVFVNVYLNLAETFAFFFLRFTFALHFNRKKQSMMNLFRKAITFFFLLLASVTMLAFTVVPHHHHEAYICFNAAHCEDETPCLPHGHEGHDHEDKGCVSQLFQTQVGRSQSGVEHPEDGRKPVGIQICISRKTSLFSLRLSGGIACRLPGDKPGRKGAACHVLRSGVPKCLFTILPPPFGVLPIP